MPTERLGKSKVYIYCACALVQYVLQKALIEAKTQGCCVTGFLWYRTQIYHSTLNLHNATLAQIFHEADVLGTDLLWHRSTMLLWHRAPAQILISLVLAEYTCTVHNPILHHCHFELGPSENICGPSHPWK